MAIRQTIDRGIPAWTFDPWLQEAQEMPGDSGPRDTLPGSTQTPEFISAWLRSNGAPGVVVVVRHQQLGLHEYLLDEIRRIDLRLKRIYLADHGSFRLNGEHPAPPRGRFSLLAPVAEVLEAAARGQTWMNGRPAFRRPHSVRERALIPVAQRQADDRS
jgi:hypothetical protein